MHHRSATASPNCNSPPTIGKRIQSPLGSILMQLDPYLHIYSSKKGCLLKGSQQTPRPQLTARVKFPRLAAKLGSTVAIYSALLKDIHGYLSPSKECMMLCSSRSATKRDFPRGKKKKGDIGLTQRSSIVFYDRHPFHPTCSDQLNTQSIPQIQPWPTLTPASMWPRSHQTRSLL